MGQLTKTPLRQYLDTLESPRTQTQILIAELLDRSARLRKNARHFLQILYVVLVIAVLFVIFAGQLTRFDVAARASAEQGLISSQLQSLAEGSREAVRLAVDELAEGGGDIWLGMQIPGSALVDRVDFIDANTGWIVGDEGYIAQTEDGGRTWNTRRTNTFQWLYGVSFIDENRGWAVGSGGTVLETFDGGSSWDDVFLDIGSDVGLTSVYFVDAQNGWMVGDYGAIYSTDDAGLSWERQESPSSADLWTVTFVDSLTGWIVGLSTVLRTDDGGATWNSVAIPGLTTKPELTDSQTGENADGQMGVAASPDPSGEEIIVDDEFDEFEDAIFLYGVDFADELNGCIVGEAGTIYSTSDGGVTWTARNSGTDAELYDVEFINDEVGWAVGESGTLLQTKNAGATWRRVQSNTTDNLFDIHFVGPQTGWIVSEFGTVLATRPIVIDVQNLTPPQLLERLQDSDGAQYFNRSGLLDELDARAIRYRELERLRDLVPENTTTTDSVNMAGLEGFFGKTTIIRIGVILLLAFLLQLLVTLYRYNSRLAAYYDARADVLFYASEYEGGDLAVLVELFSPDSLDYGKSPKLAASQVVEAAKTLSDIASKQRPRPG